MDPLSKGLCVQIEAVCGGEGRIIREYGIILNHRKVEMEDDVYEDLYTVVTPQGVDDFWAYEIKLVYSAETDYNYSITTHKEAKKWE